jgi:PST family polysaccharide transporter
MPAVTVASLLLAIFAPYVVDLIGGGAYAGATSVTRLLCLVPICVVAAMLLAQCVMVNTGLTKSLSRIYLVVGLINLAVLPELVWKLAADGAAISLVFAELLGPLLMMRTIGRLPRIVSGIQSPI